MRYRNWIALAGMGGLMLGLGAGCASDQKSTSATSSSTAPEKDDSSGKMAQSDADRAKELMAAEEKARANPGKPAGPPARSGSRAVDQPRVAPR